VDLVFDERAINDFEYEDLQKFKYFNMFLNESLLLLPSVFMINRKIHALLGIGKFYQAKI